jgi:hypothetical protein
MKVRPIYIACGVGFALQFCWRDDRPGHAKGLNQIVTPDLQPRKNNAKA